MFLDYDGTLSPIVDQPDKAFMNEGMRPVLAQVKMQSLPVEGINTLWMHHPRQLTFGHMPSCGFVRILHCLALAWLLTLVNLVWLSVV